MKFKSILSILALSAASLTASAAVDADSLASVADKSPANAALNFKAGRALYEAGRNAKARAYFARGGNDAQPWLALLELEDYKFDEASARASKYLSSKHNAQSAEHALAEDVVNRADLATTMLDRVERVIVIDSIVVDKNSFFKAYRITPTTGRVADRSALPAGMKGSRPTTVYMSENGDRMMWGADDDNGNVHIVESSLLADGTWEKPHAVSDNLHPGRDANFPFLLADGMTLYYASDGEGSLGGYDIYITRNDGDRYLNPQNIGMPYNSPMDDYLLAIDDATGVGWWATDRNLIPDSLTVYVFVPQELRDNYPVDDTPDLIDRARITSIAATHRHGEDYSRYLDALEAVETSAEQPASSDGHLMFALPDGRVITSLSQFKEPKAADLMRDYLSALDEYDDSRTRLQSLRAAYGKGDKSLGEEILAEEADMERRLVELRRMANEVITLETGN